MKTPPQMENIDPYFNSDIYLTDTFESIWCDLGNICSNFGLTKIAIYSFDNALKHKRKSFRNLYRIGREFIFIDNYDKLPEIINKLSELDSNQFYIEVLTGHLMMSRNKLKESQAHFTRALLLGAPDFLVLYGIAKWNELTKKHTESLKYYFIIIKNYASHVISQRAWFKIMSICKLDNNLKYAKRLLLTLEKVDTNFLEKEAISIQRASCFELENEDEAAIKICEALILSKPRFIFSYRLISYIYYKMKNYQAALEYLDAGLNKFSNDAYLHYLKGKIFYILKKYDRSHMLLCKAVEYSPSDPYIWNSYGIVCQRLSLYDQSEHCFRTAINLDKNFFEPKFNLMLVVRIFKKIGESKRMLDELTMSNRTDVELLSLSKNIGMDTIFYDTECRDCDFNVGTSMYFSSDLFFGANSFYVDASEFIEIELDPIHENN